MKKIIPTLMLCGCDNFKPTCNEINSVAYYFGDSVSCEFFGDLPTKDVLMTDITSEKLNKDLANSYAQITLKTKTPNKAFHLYIEYLYFKVYMTEDSEFDLNVNVTVTNVITENNVGVSDVTDTTFETTMTCHSKKDKSTVFKVYVDRVVAKGTEPATIVIDILNSEIYATNPETTFEWCIYNFTIYGESRAYSRV